HYADDAENADQSPPTQEVECWDARNEVYPAPLEKPEFRRRPMEADGEVGEKNEADEEVYSVEERIDFGGELKRRLRQQRAEHIDGENEHDDFEKAELLCCLT